MRFADLLDKDFQETLEYSPIPTISQCLEELVSGTVDFAVIPFENVTNGTVVPACDTIRDLIHNAPQNTTNQYTAQPLQDYPYRNTNIPTLINEVFVPIQHCLLSFAPSIEQVSRLYTHPQAWGQVTGFLDSVFDEKKVPRIDTSSTSAAAALVAREEAEKRFASEDADMELKPTDIASGHELSSANNTNEKFCAAIASRAASKVHNVPILQPDISNFSSNTTRFLVFTKPGFDLKSTKYKAQNINKQEYLTLLGITITQADPTAFSKCLEALISNNVNIVSMKCRPSQSLASKSLQNSETESSNTSWQTLYYIEISGSVYTDENVQKAISTIKSHTNRLTVFGQFPRAPEYYLK